MHAHMHINPPNQSPFVQMVSLTLILLGKILSRRHIKIFFYFSQKKKDLTFCMLVCVEVLQPSQPNGVMLSAVGLPNHTFTGQA